jgi:hypothetical protein
MTLFSTTQITIKPKVKYQKQSAEVPAGLQARKIGNKLDMLETAIGDLTHNQTLQYCTGGKWSMHDMIRFILSKTGPAKLWMTTWTITEEPLRVLLELIKTGQITELSAVFDYRIAKHKPEAFQFANNIITRIKLTKCHAKVAVIRNDNWNVTVIGSANFSNNPRIEVGVIFTDKDSADFNIKWIEEVIDGKEVFNA